MTLSLTDPQKTLLQHLYQAAQAQADVYIMVAADAEPMLRDLWRAGVLVVLIEDTDNEAQWSAALTPDGVALVETWQQSSEKSTENASPKNDLPRLLGMNIEFDLNVREQAALVEKMAELNREDVAGVLSSLFELHKSLTRGEIDALLQVYPAAVRTISRMVQDGFEAQMLTHEQQRIEQLLSEVSSLKTMIANQDHRPPQQAIISDEQDDSHEPIPASKPVVGLRPVLPASPNGQPKQLTVPTFDLPEDEEASEDLFVVQKDEDAGRRASQNFIESLQKLQK